MHFAHQSVACKNLDRNSSVYNSDRKTAEKECRQKCRLTHISHLFSNNKNFISKPEMAKDAILKAFLVKSVK